MKKIFGALLALGLGGALAGGAWWALRPTGFDTDHPLISDGAPIDLLAGLDTDTLSDGWVHRSFLTVSAADYEMGQDSGAPVLHCRTDNSASILARDTQIALADLPILSWDWRVTQPIVSEIDEATRDGDDHPARFFAVFTNDSQERKAMEIIWSNQKYAPGDYKIIGDFPHYVANGLDENTGAWHAQSVDLRQLYTDIGGTGTPVLDTLGFFCDSDNTGAQSAAMFKNVTLSPAPN